MRDFFRKLATITSGLVGSPAAFMLAFGFVLATLFTDNQVIFDVAITATTFLMVFLLQYTQNRDARAIHLKLDELIKAVKGARSGFIDVEDLSDEDLDSLQTEFQTLHEKYAQELKKRKKS